MTADRLQLDHKPALVVSADGPLSVNCETCGEHLAGTAYPVISVHLQTLMTLLTIHARTCTGAVS